MKVTLWGTRGSLPAPGPETARYGGNTLCVDVRGDGDTILVLDAGSGIRRLGAALAGLTGPLHLLLTHLHMDHIQGLGFFAPLYNPAVELHIWGPASTDFNLRQRLSRYLSPPLFPVRLSDLPRPPVLHEVPNGDFQVGELRIASMLVCHPGPTVGYRITNGDGVLVYIPDHEPALGVPDFPLSADWTSGYALAREADLLIHDAQFTTEEYTERIGWGHSSIDDAMKFAALARVKHFVPFHHDPAHTDVELDRVMAAAIAAARPAFPVTPAMEGASFTIAP